MEKRQEYTPTEQKVIEELKKGKSDQAISDALGIKSGTVRIHLRHIYMKTGVNSRTQLLVKLHGEE